MEEIKTNTYGYFKQELDSEFQRSSESFVRIGYLLRIAKDTDILAESGYKTVTEFAKAEYGLTPDAVSRFININERFSQGGYSKYLDDRYRPYGYAKLSEMLTLSDEVVAAIPEGATRREIQEIKKEIQKEEKISDLEVLTEPAEADKSLLDRFFEEYYHVKPEEYMQIHGRTDIYEVLAPSGSAVMMARVAGAGRMMLAIKGKDQRPELLNVRNNEKETVEWEQVWESIRRLCPAGEPEESWKMVYQEEFPITDPEPEPEKKREKAVSIAAPKPEKKPTEKKPEEKQALGAPEKTEIAPVQKEPESPMNIGAEASVDIPMNVPENPEAECTVSEEITQPIPEEENPEAEQEGSEQQKPVQEEGGAEGQQEIDNTIYDLKNRAESLIADISKAMEKRYYRMARQDARELVGVMDRICKESEKKPMPGQHEIQEYIEA